MIIPLDTEKEKCCTEVEPDDTKHFVWRTEQDQRSSDL